MPKLKYVLLCVIRHDYKNLGKDLLPFRLLEEMNELWLRGS